MTSTSRFTVPAALAVALSLALTITGCGGGGGGGGGGGSIQQPPTTNKAPIIDAQPTASPNPATEGAGGNVTISFAAHDPEGKTLTVQWRQIGGSTVARSDNGLSTSFAVPAAGSYQFIADVDDPEMARTSTDPITVTVNVPPPPPPPAGPAINFFYTETNLPLEVGLPSLAGWCNTNLTGYTESDIRVKVLDGATRYDGRVLRFNSLSEIEVELPELATSGPKVLELYFGAIATPSTITIQYNAASAQNFAVNRDNSFANGGSYGLSSISAIGSPNTPYDSGPLNGHFNQAGFAPTNRAGEYFTGGQSTSSDAIKLFVSSNGSQSSPLVITTGTPTDRGTIESVASTPDGTRCGVLWSDPSNSRGTGGGGKRYLSIVDSNLSSPPVLVPLLNVDGTGFGVMTPGQVIRTFIDGQYQDCFVTGDRRQPYKMHLVPMTNNTQPNGSVEVPLDVKPEVIHFYRDRTNFRISAIVVGRNAITGVMESQGVDFDQNGPSVISKVGMFNSSLPALGVELHVEMVGNPPAPHVKITVVPDGSNAYHQYDVTAGTLDTKTFSSGALIADQFVVIPGVGFAVSAIGGGTSELHISRFGQFATPFIESGITDDGNALGVTARDVVWMSFNSDRIRTYRIAAPARQTVNFASNLLSTPTPFFAADRQNSVH